MEAMVAASVNATDSLAFSRLRNASVLFLEPESGDCNYPRLAHTRRSLSTKCKTQPCRDYLYLAPEFVRLWKKGASSLSLV